MRCAESSSSPKEFSVGERVEGNIGASWFDATIEAILGPDKYELAWDDGAEKFQTRSGTQIRRKEAKPQSLPPLVCLQDLRQEPISCAVAPEEWMDEIRSMLSDTFRSQLGELRDFCEEMQCETKDVIRQFLESSTVSTATKQELPAGWCKRPDPKSGKFYYWKEDDPDGTVTFQLPKEVPRAPAKVEQLCVGSNCVGISNSRPPLNHAPKQEPIRMESMEEAFGWTVPAIVPVQCEAHDVNTVWQSANSQVQSFGDKGKEVVFQSTSDSKKPPKLSVEGKVPGLPHSVPRSVGETEDGLMLAALSCPASFHTGTFGKGLGITKESSAKVSEGGTVWGRARSGSVVRKTKMGALASRMSKKHAQRQIVSNFKRVDGSTPMEVPATAMCLAGVCQGAQILVHSQWFDYFMGALLLANAICMGVGVNIMAVNNLGEAPSRFRLLDLVFNVVFSIELFMRILAFREVFFKIDGWRWNAFDMFIVSIGWLNMLAGLVLKTESVIEKVGVIRLLRLGRIARLIRMVRLIPELKSMVYLIMASMSSFLWALVLIMMGVYCMAVYFTELALDMVQKGQVENADQVREQWGSVFQSILSLYMSITGGDDWRNFIEPFKAGESAQYILTTVIFAIYIAFATLVMLNLVTGVFVDGAQRIIKEEKDFEIMTMAAKVFLDADDDESQDISYEEWNFQLNAGSLDEYIKAVGITKDEASRLFHLLDLDGSGTINIVEFVRGCLRLRGPAKAMDTAEMLHQMKRQNNDALEQIKALQLSFQRLVTIEAPARVPPALRNSEESAETSSKEFSVGIIPLCDI